MFHSSQHFCQHRSSFLTIALLWFLYTIVHTSDCSNALLSTSFQACLWLLAGGKYRKQSPLHHQIRVIHWLVNQWREKRDTRDTAWQSAPSPTLGKWKRGFFVTLCSIYTVNKKTLYWSQKLTHVTQLLAHWDRLVGQLTTRLCANLHMPQQTREMTIPNVSVTWRLTALWKNVR